MAVYAGPERRKHRRIYRIIGTNIIRHNDKEYNPKLDEEVGLNISLGGMLIECEKQLAKEDRLKLKVMLTFDSVYKIIQPTARIVWTRKTERGTYFLGCQFTRLSPPDRLNLRRYVSSF